MMAAQSWSSRSKIEAKPGITANRAAVGIGINAAAVRQVFKPLGLKPNCRSLRPAAHGDIEWTLRLIRRARVSWPSSSSWKRVFGIEDAMPTSARAQNRIWGVNNLSERSHVAAAFCRQGQSSRRAHARNGIFWCCR
jgi:hypothetical protein